MTMHHACMIFSKHFSFYHKYIGSYNKLQLSTESIPVPPLPPSLTPLNNPFEYVDQY